MNDERKHVIDALKLYAVGINEIFEGHYATVDLSGSTLQLIVKEK